MLKNNLILKLFETRLSIINIGIENLVEHLSNYDVKVIQVDWRPPAGGKAALIKKLHNLIE